MAHVSRATFGLAASIARIGRFLRLDLGAASLAGAEDRVNNARRTKKGRAARKRTLRVLLR